MDRLESFDGFFFPVGTALGPTATLCGVAASDKEPLIERETRIRGSHAYR